MIGKQLTVLIGNSALRVGNVFSVLGREGINIRAHCLVDNGDGYCKLRLVVSDPDKALEVLNANKLAAVTNEVLIIETDDKPGGLSRMLELFKDSDIRIEYSYIAATEKPGTAVMVFRFSDNEAARHILNP